MLDKQVISESYPAGAGRETGARVLPLASLGERVARLDLFAIMTLLLLLLYPSDFWYVRIPLTVLCVSAFVFRRLRLDSSFWFVVAMVVMAGNYQNWFLVDNHKYLLGYWCLSLFCCLQTDDPRRALAAIAHWLIGLSFLFAVCWKVVSNDYLDGTFFHYTLLLDDRFRAIAESVGGMTPELTEANRTAYRALVNFDSGIGAVPLLYPKGIANLAWLFTWWTLLIEMLVAAAFLWPAGKLISKWRDYILLVFILSTYSVAPVLGFGWTLIIMGLAQCEERLKYVPRLYMLAFVILQIYNLPFRAILAAGPS
jgi:hypothetical protein